MQKKPSIKRRNLNLNVERVRQLTPDDLRTIAGGQSDYTGFGSMNGKSCNTCNCGL